MLKQAFMQGLISGGSVREKITHIMIEPCALDKWIEQNAGDVADVLEGCLLDNLIVYTRRGVAAVYEYPLNCWSSCYRIEWQAGDAPDVWERWGRFEEEYNS